MITDNFFVEKGQNIMKLTKRIALFIAVLTLALVSAVPAFAAEKMGDCEYVKTVPAGFDSAIVIEAVNYTDTVGGKKNEKADLPYAYVKKAKDGSATSITYTFKVEKDGLYDIVFAIRAKKGEGFREGVFVLDGKYRYDVSLQHKESDILEYATGYNLVELKAGEHTLVLTPSERFDDETYEAVNVNKILIKYEGAAAVKAPEKAETVTAPKTADGITMLVFAAAGAALVISKKRG